MSGSAKRVALLGAFTALGTVLLLLTRALPAGRLGLMVLASFPVCAALLRFGPGWAAGVFAVTATLAFLLLPGAVAIGYAAFFGYYPIVKSLCERYRRRWLGWGLKLAVYAAAFAVCWLAARALFGEDSALPWKVLLPLGAVVFALYDWCYSVVIRYYVEKIARYIP